MHILPIPGWPGYHATEDGRIASTRRGVLRELVPERTVHGYHRVCLMPANGGPAEHHSVHALVLLTFVGPRPEGEQARHLNGIRTDNRRENLAWGTVAENHDDKRVHGTVARGSRQGSAILDEAAVREIKARLAGGATAMALAAEFGVSRSTVDAIKHGRNWAHVKEAS